MIFPKISSKCEGKSAHWRGGWSCWYVQVNMDSTSNTEPKRARICLVKRSWIVPRGVAHERYRVWHNDGWLDAERHPDATAAEASEDDTRANAFAQRRPGEQYRCEIELVLPLGTLVEKIVTWPGRSKAAGDSLSSWLAPLGRERVSPKDSLYVVAGNYRLERYREGSK